MNLKPTSQYLKLDAAYDFYNKKLFEGVLPDVIITLQQQRNTAGYYCPYRYDGEEGRVSEIALNPDCFYSKEEAVMQTLVHEMCHHWQEVESEPPRKCYHNKEWAKKMESIGLMPSSTGYPGGRKTGQTMSDYIIPGGLFERYTQKLLSSQKIIEYKFFNQWAYTANIVAEIAADNGIEIPETEEIIVGSFVTDERGNTGKITSIENGEAVVAGLTVKPGMNLFIKVPENIEKNKTCYQCPGCKSKVWGKPNLRIICEDCQLKYETA